MSGQPQQQGSAPHTDPEKDPWATTSTPAAAGGSGGSVAAPATAAGGQPMQYLQVLGDPWTSVVPATQTQSLPEISSFDQGQPEADSDMVDPWTHQAEAPQMDPSASAADAAVETQGLEASGARAADELERGTSLYAPGTGAEGSGGPVDAPDSAIPGVVDVDVASSPSVSEGEPHPFELDGSGRLGGDLASDYTSHGTEFDEAVGGSGGSVAAPDTAAAEPVAQGQEDVAMPDANEPSGHPGAASGDPTEGMQMMVAYPVTPELTNCSRQLSAAEENDCRGSNAHWSKTTQAVPQQNSWTTPRIRPSNTPKCMRNTHR